VAGTGLDAKLPSNYTLTLKLASEAADKVDYAQGRSSSVPFSELVRDPILSKYNYY